MTDTVYDWDDMPTIAELIERSKPLPPDTYTVRINKVHEPQLVPFEAKDQKTGKPLLDKDGNPVKRYQSKIEFEVMEADDETWVGRNFSDFYTLSLGTLSKLKPLVEAALGGTIPADWKPNPRELEGVIIKATTGLKDPNKDGKQFPKIVAPLPYRGRKKFPALTNGATETPDEMDDVPF